MRAFQNVMPQTLVYMPNGKNLAAVSGVGWIRIWDAATKALEKEEGAAVPAL